MASSFSFESPLELRELALGEGEVLCLQRFTVKFAPARDISVIRVGKDVLEQAGEALPNLAPDGFLFTLRLLRGRIRLRGLLLATLQNRCKKKVAGKQLNL